MGRRRSRSSPAPQTRCSTAGSSRRSSRPRWPPTPIIGAFAAPSMPGTAYVLFHHVMGECNGVRGVWGYVRGGMGGLSQSIAAAAREKGVEIRGQCARFADPGKRRPGDGRRSGRRHGTPCEESRIGRRRPRHLLQVRGRWRPSGGSSPTRSVILTTPAVAVQVEPRPERAA